MSLKMKERSWACTLITQLSLCMVAYIAINTGQPQNFYRPNISNENAMYFISVAGGFRPLKEQILLLQQMVKVKKTYNALFVVGFSELGESDPLLLNATLFRELRNMPWYPSGALKGVGETYFSKKIELPDGQTLDIIALDTVLLQDRSSVRGNDQIVWLTRILNESNSDWKVAVGVHQLISSDCNIRKTNKTAHLELLQDILLQYGVDVYMSTETCDDNTTARGNANKAIHLTAMNHNLFSKEETTGGFLLHRVSSLEMATFVVKMTGEVEHRLSFQQRGRASM